MVVPCYNEEALAKLEDIRLDYPRDRLEVIFADGGSSDRTWDLLTTAIRTDEPLRALRCPRGGKIHQLNHARPMLRGEIIVNTDADARLAPDALKWMAAEFAAAPAVRVVGAYCRPADALKIERYHWDAQNRGRFLESDARSSSIVTASCYAFRRELFDAFPEDVIADDIYGFVGEQLGITVVYSAGQRRWRPRSPELHLNFPQVAQEQRLSAESLRFLSSAEMSLFCKMMLLTSSPTASPALGAVVVAVAAGALGRFRFDLIILGVVF